MPLQAFQTTTTPREAPELSPAYPPRNKLEEEEGEPENVWDCGSPLYDSYELASLGHLLDRNTMALSESSPESELSPSTVNTDGSGSAMKAEASCKQRSSAKSSGKKVARMFRSGFSAFVRSVMKNS
ncbi:zinc_ribbon_12 domain-containing protein [Psidium guajava]|nr:zinc_ribbon_12 domain-containing protein [Psidium guajava]